MASPRVGSVVAGAPVPVHHRDGRVHSWFVPVTVDTWLAGFFQFLADGTLMRYSSFQRRPDSLANCPEADTWTDPEAIRRQARIGAHAGETALAPFLTFEDEPTRLAWAVPLAIDGKVVRTVMVAGRSVWEARAPDEDVDAYGGSSSA